MTNLPPGRRVSIVELGATPIETIERSLQLRTDEPAPTNLAPSDVLIRVRSANVGWVDLLMASGQYQHVPDPPYTPGLEFAGEIVARGTDVDFDIGQGVIADGLRTGPRSLGNHRRWGGFASYAIAPADAVFPRPDGLSFDEGACFLGGAETAYHALVTRAELSAGEFVLVLGATGSTGLAAVALAKHLGARVIAAGRTPSKLEVATSVGADHVIVLGDGASLRDRVKALTDGRGADVIYDAVGGPLSTQALRAASFGARFIVVGWASTPFAARGDQSPNTLPTNLILMKSIDVLGSPAAISVHRDPTLRPQRIHAIFNAAEALRPHVAATFDLRDVADALRAKWRGEHAGNIVVHP